MPGDLHQFLEFDGQYDNVFTGRKRLLARLSTLKPGNFSNQTTIQSTHVLPIKSIYKPFVNVVSEYAKVLHTPNTAPLNLLRSNSLNFQVIHRGHFLSDMVLHLQIPAIGLATDAYQYRYCAFPGVRLLPLVQLKKGGAKIDSYTSDDVMLHYQFVVCASRQLGFQRCVGQQEIKTAEFDAGNHTGILHYKDGAQTWKSVQPTLNLWIPLHFSFCRDVGEAIMNTPSLVDDWDISINLADVTKIIQMRNASTLEVVTNAAIMPNINFNVHGLYVNELYIPQQIFHTMVMNTTTNIQMSLIRVHRSVTRRLTTDSALIPISSELQYPIEHIFAGVRDVRNEADMDNWCMFGRASLPRTLCATSVLAAHAQYTPAGGGMVQLVGRICRESPTDCLQPMLESIQLDVDHYTFFPKMELDFYGSYMPNRYSESSHMVSPRDSSVMLLSFTTKPGQWQPSGFCNAANSSFVTINYQSRMNADGSHMISTQTPAELILSAYSLNFLIRSPEGTDLLFKTQK